MSIAHGTKRYWRAAGHRLRLSRLALGISEEQAAEAYGVRLRTYRGYEAGKPQQGNRYLGFARKYDVSIDWLMDADSSTIRSHLGKYSEGKLAILPAKGPQYRRRMAYTF